MRANMFMCRMQCASPRQSASARKPSAPIGACRAADPLTGQQVAAIASRYLVRAIKLRTAGMTMLRLVGLFNKDLRGFLQMAPEYLKPVRYDARKLEGLLGAQAMTPYATGIAQTFDWLAEHAA
jgi:hypothetical protein